MNATEESISIRRIARVTGLVYLVSIVLALFPGYAYSSLIVPGDIAATAQRIMAGEGLLSLGFISDLLHQTLYLFVAWALYVLLKPVGKNLALLFLICVSIGVAIQCVNVLANFTSLHIFSEADYRAGTSITQLNALAIMFRALYENGILVAQIFFGFWLLPLGYLVYKSSYFPKILGVFLMLGCFGLLIEVFQNFLLPSYKTLTYPGLVIGGLAEISFCLWLLIMGVRVQEPVTLVNG